MFKNERGVTLVEVLAAVVLLGIAVIIFVNLSGYTLLAGKKSDYKTAALRIGEKVLNEKRAEIAASAPALPWTVSSSTADDGSLHFKVFVQQTDMASPAYSKTGFGSHYLSLNAVALFKTSSASSDLVPRLLTVTVSWEE
ncbi:type IV pilus modification PilV family protein [Paenibacillus thalictri]|uniref:Prepilin-type N-terminal cleavage/methylation domain-containing protein n=1 Tax=Paenibacillus thalictri TaxID=2527873 RepID=A0A4Q9DW56_9BACL|nr:prepilin-type N-terminal cleavage/methylation domain-containing protein [Paenibacillus thalictri]TBL80229.1 prepilin-type N-terminal cleavage/methylation domain-containing protein [Paenibacillus thalictri]